MSLPTLRQLQFFTSLGRHGSFSRAAEETHVSQSTLSAGIKELETVLDAQLVDRTSRQVALTPLGDDIARRAEALLRGVEDLVRAAASQPPLSGDLRLGVIPTIAPYLLPDVIPPLSTSHPQLRLYLREELTDPLIEGLRCGRLDMAVLAMPVETQGLDTLIFAEDPFVFACAPDHPLADEKAIRPAQLDGERLFLLEDGHCLRDHALDACRLRERQTADAYGATSLFTLAQMVRSGLGTTLLPRIAVDHGLAGVAGLKTIPLVDADGTAPSRDLGLAWRHGSGREEEARALALILGGAASA